MSNDLYSLLSELSEIESELTSYTRQRDDLRARISELVEKSGGKVVLPGFARAEIRSPSVVESYDRGKVDEMITTLESAGLMILADELRQCKQRSARAGGLSVTFERKARG